MATNREKQSMKKPKVPPTQYVCARCNGPREQGSPVCGKPQCNAGPRSLHPDEVDERRAAAIAEITARLERRPRWR